PSFSRSGSSVHRIMRPCRSSSRASSMVLYGNIGIPPQSKAVLRQKLQGEAAGWGGLRIPGAQQLFHVFADDVGLQVDHIPRPLAAQNVDGGGMGDDRDGEVP